MPLDFSVSRTGALGQITAVDDAVKATGTEVLSIEFPQDTKGWEWTRQLYCDWRK